MTHILSEMSHPYRVSSDAFVRRDAIVREVQAEFPFATLEALQSASVEPRLVGARWIVAHRLKAELRFTHSRIGRFLHRDHSSIWNAVVLHTIEDAYARARLPRSRRRKTGFSIAGRWRFLMAVRRNAEICRGVRNEDRAAAFAKARFDGRMQRP